MSAVWAVVAAAGRGSRFQGGGNKVFAPLCGLPLLTRTLLALARYGGLSGVVLVYAPDEAEEARRAADILSIPVIFTKGGAERLFSVREGLRVLPPDCETVLIHDGARPFLSVDLIERCVKSAREHGSGVAARLVTDTIKRVSENQTESETLDRSALRAAQTPQAFSRAEIAAAYESIPEGFAATDDAQIYTLFTGKPARFVEGEPLNIKITTPEDMRLAESLFRDHMETRIGQGFDAHRLAIGRKLILCGEKIPYERGLDGHSDADVAVHALIDAILGACAMGDIGMHFPDSDKVFKGADSIELLKESLRRTAKIGFTPAQADITVIAQRPKLAPFIPQMRQNIADALKLSLDRVSVKATTTERMGFTGSGEGIAAQALAVMNRPLFS